MWTLGFTFRNRGLLPTLWLTTARPSWEDPMDPAIRRRAEGRQRPVVPRLRQRELDLRPAEAAHRFGQRLPIADADRKYDWERSVDGRRPDSHASLSELGF